MLTIILLLTNILALEAAVIKAPSEPKIGAKKLLLLLILLLMLQLLLLLGWQLLFFYFLLLLLLIQPKKRCRQNSDTSGILLSALWKRHCYVVYLLHGGGILLCI